LSSKKEQEKAAKIEEGYIALGKRRATDIRNSKTKNVLEQMVYTLSKSYKCTNSFTMFNNLIHIKSGIINKYFTSRFIYNSRYEEVKYMQVTLIGYLQFL